MKKTELILGFGVLGLMILRLLIEFRYSAILITLFTLLLSMLYFVFSFGLLNQIRFRDLFKKESYILISSWRIIGTVLTGFVLSMVVIYSLFKFQRWPYGNEGLKSSLFLLLFIIMIAILKLVTSKKLFYSKLLYRLIIVGGFSSILYFTPYESLIEMKYRNFPEYVKVEKELLKDPTNRELQIKSDELRIKMDESK